MTKLFDGFNVSSFIIAFLIILGIPSCSGNDDTNPIHPCCQTTSAIFSWSGDINCYSLGVVKIKAILTDGNGRTLVSGSWPCSVYSGNLSNMPSGSEYKLIVIAENSNGTGIYQGTKTGINIIKDRTNNIGVVYLDSVTSLKALISSSTGNQSISSGQSIIFQGLVTGGIAPYTYQWSFGDGSTNSTVQDPGSIIFSAAGIYTVTFQVTDANGGMSSDSVTITVQ